MIIAIDGYSSCGKSTLAKDLAVILDLTYVDSGAMYRAVTYAILQEKVSLTDLAKIERLLDNIHIHFERIDQRNCTFLNGQNIESDIRGKEVSNNVSPVATIGIVRSRLVEMQRQLGNQNNGVVMDGRDIGTVVYPHADFKFFITAHVETRTQRRYDELKAAGKEQPYDEVRFNLIQRDKIDTTREISPLVKANDAIVIDNTLLDREAQLHKVLEYVNKTALL